MVRFMPIVFDSSINNGIKMLAMQMPHVTKVTIAQSSLNIRTEG